MDLIYSKIIFIIVLFLACVAIRKDEWKYMAVGTTFALIILLNVSGVLYVQISSFNSFFDAHELTVCFGVLLLMFTSTAALWSRRHEMEITEERNRKLRLEHRRRIGLRGFVEETNLLHKTGWESYIKALSERLAKTKLTSESFALGISGDWGAGKTTFLNQLKHELSKSFLVIDFNPWACTDSNFVITDFFKTLKANMPKDDKGLISDISRYVRLLTDADMIPKPFGVLLDLFSNASSYSITTLKAEIEKKLSESQNRYAVLIDDLDRLQQDELFEILRLIRVTASFSNILFIVTYDRHHIHDMLKQNGISEAHQYVKKIFNTEVILPEVEPYVLPMMLIEEIELLLGKESQIPAYISGAIMKKDSFDTYELLRYLKNFRDVKRFAMAFAANISTVGSYKPGEFSFTDFFWLEILRYIDYDTYSMLRVYPAKYLSLQNNMLTVKKGLDMESDTKSVMNQLFSQSADSPHNSIAYMHNFRNYFSFRIQDNKLSQSEFKEVLGISDKDKMKDAVNLVFTQGKLKSLLELFNNESVNLLSSLQERKNYITLLFVLIPHTKSGFIGVIKKKMEKCACDGADLEDITLHANKLLDDLVKNCDVKQRGYINMMLAALHSESLFNSTEEDPCHIVYESLIDDATLVEKAETNMCAIFNTRKLPVDILEVTNPKNNLRRFLEAATVRYETDVTYDQVVSSYKCLPFYALLRYFEKMPSDKLDEFMKPFTFQDDEIGLAEDEDYFQNRRNKIEEVFGSLKNFAEFTYRCFNNTDEDKDRWIVKYWRLPKPAL